MPNARPHAQCPPPTQLSEAGDDCLADYQRCITTFSGGKVFQSTAFRERLADDPSLMKLLSCQNASPPPPSPPTPPRSPPPSPLSPPPDWVDLAYIYEDCHIYPGCCTTDERGYCHYDVWSSPGTIKRAGNRASWSNRVWSDGLITSATGDSKRGITFRLPYEHNGGQVQGFYALTSE